MNFIHPLSPLNLLPRKSGGPIFWGLVAVFVLGLASANGINKKESRQIVIVYSGNTLGELKPCGCDKEEDQGGIERRMSYLNEVRAGSKNTLVVDTGDNFKAPTRQGKIKGKYLMQAMVDMKYDAVTLGDHDFVYGNSFISELKDIPWVLSNMESSLPLAKTLIKRFDDGLQVAVIAVADPDLLYGSHHSETQVTDPQKNGGITNPQTRSGKGY